jgi:tripartite-type tricarboxylate transporter receptor subunit TctC
MLNTSLLIKISAATLALPMLVGSAVSQSYPTRPITLIVPAPPGGGTDVFARALGEIVETTLKQKVVIENRAGGGGTLGVTQLVNSKADGYTLAFIWNSPITTSPHSLAVSFTPDNYRGLMSIGYSSYVICAQPTFAANNAKEMIEKLKEPGTRFTYGNDGVGGTMQLAAERIFSASGVKVRAIPFSGAGETAKNFLGGHVDFYGGSLPPILAHAKAGKAKCLLLTSAGKNEALPEADGLEAIGLADKQTVLWWGMIAPKDIPDDIAKSIEVAFTDAAKTDKFKEIMAKQGATLDIKDSTTTNALIRSELAALGEVAKAAGIEKKAQ